MAELHLVPDERVFIQAALYLAGLAAAHVFLVKPLVAINRERVRRTSGSAGVAESELHRIESLEKDYKSRLAGATSEALALRDAELAAGTLEAESIIRDAGLLAKDHVDKARAQFAQQLAAERTQIGKKSQEVARAIVDRLLVAVPLAFAMLPLGAATPARAAGGEHVDFWYGIFWPYVQFAMFVAGFWYFGRKGFAGLLEKKRDALRTQLSEARQATHQAELRAREYELKAAALQQEIVRLKDDHAADGARQRQYLVDEAKRTRDQILRDSEKRISELLESSRESLRRELVEETMRAVTEQLDAQKRAELSGRMRDRAVSFVKAMGSEASQSAKQ